MRAIYFCDENEYIEDEKRNIQNILKKNSINIDIEVTVIPPFKEKFDILFFDWGGMSIGNSNLQYFCRYIINLAIDNPSRIFIMTSKMTSYAMEDALKYFKDEKEIPHNIYLSIEKAIQPIKNILK